MVFLTIWRVLVLVLAIAIGWSMVQRYQEPPVPEVKPGWWGRGDPRPGDDKSLKPFQINISESAIKDFKKRLQDSRLAPLSVIAHYKALCQLLQDF